MYASAAKCSTSQRIVRPEAERKRHSGRGSASFDTSTWASMPSVGSAPWMRCAGAWVTPSWHLRQAYFGHTVLAMHRHGLIELPPPRWQRGYPKPIVFGPDTVPPLFPPRAPSTRSGRSRYASSCIVPRSVGSETRATAPPLLIETFVETPHYTGAVYRASGWTQVGTTDTERKQRCRVGLTLVRSPCSASGRGVPRAPNRRSDHAVFVVKRQEFARIRRAPIQCPFDPHH